MFDVDSDRQRACYHGRWTYFTMFNKPCGGGTDRIYVDEQNIVVQIATTSNLAYKSCN